MAGNPDKRIWGQRKSFYSDPKLTPNYAALFGYGLA